MKKISRRSFLTAAAACGAAAALSACGGSSASSTAASSTAGSTAASAAAGPVTLQWSVWDKESTPYLSLIHISEPTRRTPISYAVFCLKKKKSVFLHPDSDKA